MSTMNTNSFPDSAARKIRIPQTNGFYFADDQRGGDIARERSSLVLKRYVENRYPGAFETLTCIPVYTEIPSGQSLRIAASVQPACVPVSAIREFRFEMRPNVLWLTRLERAELEEWKARVNREEVRWLLGGSTQGVSLRPIKSTFLYDLPRHPGLDLSNIWGY